MYLKATPTQLASSPELQQVALFFIMSGGGIERDKNTGVCSYHVDSIGESLLTPEHLGLFYTTGVDVEKGTFYIEMTKSEYEESTVPENFPSSTSMPFEQGGEPQPRVWKDYAPFAQESTDKTKYLVRCVRVEPGSTSGHGLSASEFPIWYAEFTTRILTKTQAQVLRETDYIEA